MDDGTFQRKYSFFGDYERQIVDALLQCSNSNSLLDKLKIRKFIEAATTAVSQRQQMVFYLETDWPLSWNKKKRR